MPGYIFSLDSINSLHWCIENGVYSTNLSSPKNNKWMIHHEGTFADYIGIKPADNIYFFIKRKIYGIGSLITVGDDCKFINYPNADKPNNFDYENTKNLMLLNHNEKNLNNRCLCTFQPSPNFFQMGIDTDDVLASNPNSFRMLRAFWKLSFIKIDDEENKALKDIILKRNENYIFKSKGTFEFNISLHNIIKSKTNDTYRVTSSNILKTCSDDNYIKHEMALEAGLIDILSNKKDIIFGNWDYISHQVIASPFKPIDYMDKMDIFGYKYIPNFDTISKYLLIELKKDKATKDAIDQIMKYVDWINQEYAFGDYSMIEAFLISYDFSQEVIDYKNEICIRNFIKGRRPTIPSIWNNIRLLKYSFDIDSNQLELEEVK